MEDAQVAVFPLLSVTVSVTAFAPRLRQVKLELDRTREATVQLSVELLFTCAVVIVAVPEPFRAAVTFLQMALGRIVSAMVITERQVEEFPLLSVTVKVTLFAPTFPQVKEEGGMDTV